MLYRRERRLAPWLIALLCILVSLPLGFLLGRLSAPAATLEEVLEPATAQVRQAAGVLDIVPLEYERAHAGSKASLEAVASASAQSLKALQGATTLQTLYPAKVQAVKQALAALDAATTADAPVAEIEAQVEALQAQIKNLVPN